MGDKSITITKRSLNEAVALIYEDIPHVKDLEFGGAKAQRECQMASMKAHNLYSAINIKSLKTSEYSRSELLSELRTSLLENNLSAAAQILEWLVKSSSKSLSPIIWKSAIVLFLNHHFRDQEILDDFLEMCTDQRQPEEKRKLIEMLVSLPDFLESRSRNGSSLGSRDEEDHVFLDKDEDDSAYETK